MNSYQSQWYEQVKSDHEMMRLLLKSGAHQCHVLHYLQMVTEKLGKAYYWRNGEPPPRSHRSLVRFLQLLDGRPKPDRERIALWLGFPNTNSFRIWISYIADLAHALENLAPSLAGEAGPNTEYPWPSDAPTVAPAKFSYPIWNQVTSVGRGQHFLKILKALVDHFPKYA